MIKDKLDVKIYIYIYYVKAKNVPLNIQKAEMLSYNPFAHGKDILLSFVNKLLTGHELSRKRLGRRLKLKE